MLVVSEARGHARSCDAKSEVGRLRPAPDIVLALRTGKSSEPTARARQGEGAVIRFR